MNVFRERTSPTCKISACRILLHRIATTIGRWERDTIEAATLISRRDDVRISAGRIAIVVAFAFLVKTESY